jgi:hypothetical protein
MKLSRRILARRVERRRAEDVRDRDLSSGNEHRRIAQ